MGHADDIAQRWQNELLETYPQCAAFLCPIKKVLMRDPVKAEDGYTYERQNIESWLSVNNLSPMKRDKDGNFVSIGMLLTPNTVMQEAIDRVRDGDLSGIVGWDSLGDPQSVDPDLQSASTVPPPTESPLVAART
jgi:hypothetical protein